MPVEDIFIPNVPVTLPLKLPLKPNVPVSVVVPGKQEPLDVNVKFVMLIEPPLASVKLVVKANAGELSGLVRLAVHVPLMLPEFELLLLLHPVVKRANSKRIIDPNDLSI